MKIPLPDFSMVVLMGPSGAGKSTFARRHFLPTEIISSDICRGLVSDDENSQEASGDAFRLVREILSIRLARRRLSVVDATSVTAESRKPLLEVARQFHALPVAIVLDIPEAECLARNRERPDRNFGGHVVRRQRDALRRSLRNMQREGFRHVFRFSSVEEVDAATIERTPLWTDRRQDCGPFDIIGDVHGCYDELLALLSELGYVVPEVADKDAAIPIRHPEGRRAVFLGDIVDRGPRISDVLRLVMDSVESGAALCVPGNHEVKLVKKLRGQDVRLTHGLKESVDQLGAMDEAFRTRVASFLNGLVSHYWLDGGRLVVAHAGLREEMHGRASGAVRGFCLWGDTTGETDEYGLPVRHDWASEYRGSATVVYGHTPVPELEWLNRTVCVDTGCVFGGRLTALRWPEKEAVSVPAARVYCDPVRPLATPTIQAGTAQQEHDRLLWAADVCGRRRVTTRFGAPVTIREENAAAAWEVLSRFGADPRWLIYLPPTMAPCETTRRDGLLEHPDEAFAYFTKAGVEQVVCEEKHMGSRAIVMLARSAEDARSRFGVEDGRRGAVVTRTGRPFFGGSELEAAFLEALGNAAERAGVWEELATTWICLDGELMPWSLKAQELLRRQYAVVGAAGASSTAAAFSALAQAGARGVDVSELMAKVAGRQVAMEAYSRAYRPYCWPVCRIDDVKFAPFHLLASEGAVHHDRDQVWHLGWADALCASESPVLFRTRREFVNLQDASAVAHAADWWQALVAGGGEGMVVKPSAFLSKGRRGLVQPGVKCRGPEYLRIIYGPEYLEPANLRRLRGRSCGSKRALAAREFVLGLEALARFVEKEPLRRVHECVAGVLALESEPVDPRL